MEGWELAQTGGSKEEPEIPARSELKSLTPVAPGKPHTPGQGRTITGSWLTSLKTRIGLSSALNWRFIGSANQPLGRRRGRQRRSRSKKLPVKARDLRTLGPRKPQGTKVTPLPGRGVRRDAATRRRRTQPPRPGLSIAERSTRGKVRMSQSRQ